MSLDVAAVGISLNTESVTQGEAVVVRSFDRMAASADKITTSTVRTAQAQQQLIAEQIRAAGGRNAYFAQLDREVAANRTATQVIFAKADAERRETEAFVRAASAKSAASAGVAEATTKIASASAGATTGLRTISTTMASLAASELGLRSGLGSLISSFGLLTAGAGLTVGITAGIALISAGWDYFTKAARAAKKETDDLIDSLVKAANAARLTPFVVSQIAQEKVAAQQAEIRRLQNAPNRVDAKTGLSTSGIDVAAVERATKELERFQVAAKRALVDVGEAQSKLGEQVVRDDKARRVRALAEQKARLGELGQIQKAELDGAIGKAKATGDFALIEQAIHAKALADIDAQVAAVSRLDQAKRKHLRTTLETNEAQAVQVRLAERLVSLLGDITPKVVDPSPLKPVITDFSNTEADPQIAKNAKAAQDAAKATRDSFIKSFESIFTRGNDGFLSLFRNIEDMARKAAARIAGAFVFDKLGLAKIGKKNEDGSTNLGGKAGAYVAAVVVVGGIVASLFDHAAKARAAAAAFKDAQRSFALSLDAYVANATGSANALSTALAASAAEEKRQRDAAAEVLKAGLAAALVEGGGKKSAKIAAIAAAQYTAALAAITAAALADGERIRKEATERKAALGEDLTIRGLRARGLTDEADTQALLLAQTRERVAIEKELGGVYDAATAAALEYTQAVEREALAKQQATAAAKRAQDTLDLEGSTSARGFRNDARRATLNGNDRDAGAFSRQASAIDARVASARAAFEAQQLFNAGTISEVLFKQITAAIEDELNLSLAELQKQAEDTAKAIAETNRQANLDLGVRRLVLNGMTEAAEIERDRIAAEREYAQAVKDGLDATTLATLRKIQEDEAAAKAIQKVIDKTKELAATLYAEARATEELTVRHLRATGFGGAGDVAAQLYAQQEEKRKAVESGRSKEYIAELDRVQAEERAAADQSRRDAQDKAFQSGLGSGDTSSALADSKTSVNLAVGVSESTAGEMVGTLRSQLVYQASLPRIEALHRETLAVQKETKILLGRLRGLTIDDVDTGLALAGVAGDQVAGVTPGNR